MQDIEKAVLDSQINAQTLEVLIREYERFILHSVFRVTHRFVTIHDDEYSIALEAFVEAVRAFDPSKGRFLSFSYLVIKRRLIDYIKSNRYRAHETSVDPVVFSGEQLDDLNSDNLNVFLKTSVDIVASPLYWEISSLNDTLSTHKITFNDLATCSPKAEKTKSVCAKAIVFILKNATLLESVRVRSQLPLQVLQNTLNVPRKTFEAHRKYIIAAVEIMAGDYPLLSEYLKPVKEEMLR